MKKNIKATKANSVHVELDWQMRVHVINVEASSYLVTNTKDFKISIAPLPNPSLRAPVTTCAITDLSSWGTTRASTDKSEALSEPPKMILHELEFCKLKYFITPILHYRYTGESLHAFKLGMGVYCKAVVGYYRHDSFLVDCSFNVESACIE